MKNIKICYTGHGFANGKDALCSMLTLNTEYGNQNQDIMDEMSRRIDALPEALSLIADLAYALRVKGLSNEFSRLLAKTEVFCEKLDYEI